MRIALLIQYEGTCYHGWQIQPEQATIQGLLEEALHKLYGENIGIIGSGRTDSGVHALGQVAHYNVDHTAVPPDNIWMALNQRLPRDIRILSSREVRPDFHSRFEARERNYEYRISTKPNVLRRNSQWHIRFPLETRVLEEMADLIRGVHDFSSFCYAGTETENMICNIMSAQWVEAGPGEMIFKVQGNRFLHHMVRMLVGSMVEVARGKWNPANFEHLLKHPDRQAHAVTAPARGLALVKVAYSEDHQPLWFPESQILASQD